MTFQSTSVRWTSSRILLQWILGASALLWNRVSTAYPVVLQVDEGTYRCLNFNIAEDDDAHIVVLPLPHEEQLMSVMEGNDEKEQLKQANELEAWYVEQVYKMTKQKNERNNHVLPKSMPDQPPDKVARIMSEFLKDNGGIGEAPMKVGVTVQSYDSETAEKNYPSTYFIPSVLNHIRQHHHPEAVDENYESVRVCFINEDEEGELVQVIFDMILVSEEVPDDGSEAKPTQDEFQKDKHLTPLEESLDRSIAAARNVLKEIRYMETREQRMRMTADAINSRVHWFSYISVGVLLFVTYIQVGYLKRYFKKMKLM